MKNLIQCSLLPAALMMASLALVGCTWRTEHKVETVHKIDAHITLDIRQVQTEAAQVEDYVRSDEPTTETATQEKPVSWDWTAQAEQKLAARSWLEILSPFARAQAQNLDKLSDEEIQALERRKERSKQIDEGLKKHYIGENNQGYVEVLIPKDTEEKELRETWIKLADAENKDRRIIYKGAARRQGESEAALPIIERVFAQQIRTKLEAGMYFQVPKNEKFLEAFRESELGKHYPDAKPGAWVKMVKLKKS